MNSNSRMLELSEETFRQVIGLAGMSGKWGLPLIYNNQDEYVKAREELSNKSYAYEDFDGKIHPNKTLACMMDVFKHAAAGFSLKTRNSTVFIIRGQIDSVYMKRESTFWTLERILLEETWLRIEAVKKENKEEISQIESQRVEQIENSDKEVFCISLSDKISDLKKEIDKHQFMFWHETVRNQECVI